MNGKGHTDKMKHSTIRTGVIAAAGKGTRAYPRTTFIPKPLFLIEDSTLLEKNIRLQFEVLKVERVYIIVGHLKEMVIAEVERIRQKFPGKEIFTSEWTGRGLAADVASLRDRIREDFVLILGDELYFHTDHEKLISHWKKRKNAQALIGILKTHLQSDIRKNYSVDLDKDRVIQLIEKPEFPHNDILGLGSYVFSPTYFDHFDATPPSERSGVVELTDVIDQIAKQTDEVYATLFKGRYFNINSVADLYSAIYFTRSEKFNKYKISVIIPTHNNESTLPDVISDFKNHVHEIIITDMASTDRTIHFAKKEKVRVVEIDEDRIGNTSPAVFYAPAIFSAMEEAKGDILVLASADGSFRARDLPKLLEYMKDSDMVVGTRTTRQMIEQGSNLVPMNRWINVFFGKMVEILWWSQEPRLTDIGCVYRAIWKDSFLKIKEDLKSNNKTFLTEMMIEIMRYHMRSIEIPVSYYKKYGKAAEESNQDRWSYFWAILKLIIGKKFKR